MDTGTIEKPATAWIVPADLESADPTITLPIEIHHVGDGNWYACYDGVEDVEYPDLYELARDHQIDVTHETLTGWQSYTYKRDVEVCGG